MGRIFYTGAEGEWAALELDAPSYWLVPDGAPRVAVGLGRGRARPGALLHAWSEGDADGGWALLVRPGARVFHNGEPVVLGVAALRHCDELRVADGGPHYFSDERRLAVEPCPGSDAPRCPRCAQPIARGEASVLCPGCGVRHHQLEERSCWTYVETCALCEQPTALDAGLRWTPEGL